MTEVRGFAGIIENVLKPINNNSRFKEKFAEKNFKILLNAVNVNYAALITVENGFLSVESVKNSPKENLSKENLGWDALIEMDSPTFLALSMKRISMAAVAKKWLSGNIKMKGIPKLLNLLKMLAILTKD